MTGDHEAKHDKVTIPKQSIPLENEEPKEDIFPPDWRSHFCKDKLVEGRARVNGSCISKPEGLYGESEHVEFNQNKRARSTKKLTMLYDGDTNWSEYGDFL